MQVVFIEQRSVHAAAVHAGINYHTLYHRLARARRALAWWLRQEGGAQ